MATLQQRTQRRRRKIKSRQLMEVSCDLVNAEKKSADIERLAYRYTQKCSVDSSTESESESDTNIEFVDPYDGDDEELSSSSDCDLDFDDSAVVLLGDPIKEIQARKDHPPEKQVILSASPSKIIIANKASEPLQTTELEPPWFATPNSEMSTSDDTLQPMLIDCDYKLCEDQNTNKKQRRPALESGEKLRKRLRVI